MSAPPPKLLYFAPQTILPISRSGIQRVARDAAEALLGLAAVELVKWDQFEGQLRYFNAFDCEIFFGTKTWKSIYRPHRLAERRRYRFIDTIPENERATTWLFMPEIYYHLPNGKLIYRSAIAQAREQGMKTATIFYDLIPITNPAYQEQAKIPHEIYMGHLLDVDLVLPISEHSANELRLYEREHFGIDEEARSRLKRCIAAVPLAESTARPRPEGTNTSKIARDLILLLGTIEPRKRQTNVLRMLRDRGITAAHQLKVAVVGSLHSKSADEFRDVLASFPEAEYHGYLSDREIDELWERARFSVFASNDEGFGLPICESLARGVPCLTADFGAMREVAAAGGCVLVDVNSDEALAGALTRLAGDDGLVSTLQEEIRRRPPRTWMSYAADILERIEAYQVRYGTTSIVDTIGPIVEEFDRMKSDLHWSMDNIQTKEGATWGVGCARGLTPSGARAFAAAVAAEHCDHVILRFAGSASGFPDYDDESLQIFLAADVWSFESKDAYESLVLLANERAFPRLLPSRCCFDTFAGSGSALASALMGLQLDIERRRLIARREEAFAAACQRDPMEPGLLLLIVISTYNRGPFVAENVRWLTKHIEPFGGRVRLKVVDNASTDDTAERLEGLSDHAQVEVLRNVSNVGMLGNLRVCSTLLEAEYTWVVGDDDFITPGTIANIIQVLEQNRGLPFVFVNFGVYFSLALGPGDTADSLIQAPALLAPAPSPSGIYAVRDIALEHDNLFTAIYPIVFRTDVLSACFNYTFTGVPFSSLIESIPTTKLILETYGEARAYWLASVGIVGNAHNSWQKYRVNWHGVIMPLAFALASEAGVDRTKLLEWAHVHEALFDDAARQFPGQRLVEQFSDDDLETSFRVFRKRLDA